MHVDLQIKDPESLFEEVDEEEYAKLVAKRRQDDFVEEDGDDLGYKDDGEEAWNRYTPRARFYYAHNVPATPCCCNS
jgi:hypothetical protein